jgi:hypothetical protein
MSDIGKCGCLYKANIARTKYAHVHIGVPRKTVEEDQNGTVKRGYSAGVEKRVSKMTCCTCITPGFFQAIGHQVLAIAGFVASLTLFSHPEESDKRSKAAKLTTCSRWSVSGMSQQFLTLDRKVRLSCALMAGC